MVELWSVKQSHLHLELCHFLDANLNFYHQNLKNWDSMHNIVTIIVLEMERLVLQCSNPPKCAARMANSVEPDQTAQLRALLSGSALFAQTYLSQYFKFLLLIHIFREDHLVSLAIQKQSYGPWNQHALVCPLRVTFYLGEYLGTHIQCQVWSYEDLYRIYPAIRQGFYPSRMTSNN